MTQSKLAKMADVGQDHISYLESNNRKASINTLILILEALEVESLSVFFQKAESLSRS